MGVRRIPGAHLLDHAREKVTTVENLSVLGEEAENQPRHKVVHILLAPG